MEGVENGGGLMGEWGMDKNFVPLCARCLSYATAENISGTLALRKCWNSLQWQEHLDECC